MHLSNWEKWRLLTDALPTPDNMIDWSWFFVVSSSLERRVWIGPEHQQLFPNMYMCFVSKPGIGKTLAVGHINALLRRWHRGDNAKMINEMFTTPQQKGAAEVTMDMDKQSAEDNAPKSRSNEAEVVKPYIVKLVPDASTYEALIVSFGKSVGRINYVKKDKEGNPGIGLYIHCSMCAILPELGSLLRKRSNDVVTFLLGVYDCPLDYDYETISRQRDRIRKGCLNLLAATNPSFMQETLDEKLVNEAFVSRVFYIYANKNRKPVTRFPELTEAQRQCKHDLEQHVLKLTTLYGQVTMEEETWDWIHQWWCDLDEHPEKRGSTSPKLDPFCSRLVIHVEKLAMALHFSERTDMVIPLETVQRAVKIIHNEMKSMHLALVLESKDKGAIMVRKILEYLRDSEMSYVDLYMKVYQAVGMVDKKVFEEALEFLVETKQIGNRVDQDKDTGEQLTMWRLK